ncbi:MAG: GntR family transcriptional regulator [Pseudomonadota bacterium]
MNVNERIPDGSFTGKASSDMMQPAVITTHVDRPARRGRPVSTVLPDMERLPRIDSRCGMHLVSPRGFAYTPEEQIMDSTRKRSMRSSPQKRPPHLPSASSPEEKLDKQSYVPAYAQLAGILRRRISGEIYTPGSRLPSETAIARGFKVSAMTVRQAVGLLVDEGLVERIQGRGTFVKRLDVATSHFGLDSLRNALTDNDHVEVRILKATVEKARGRPQEALGLAADDPVVVVERVILHRSQPLTLQVGYAVFDPESPTVENMLDTQVLTGLLFQENRGSFMKGELWLLPDSLNEREAALLGTEVGKNAFRLEHIFYDFTGRPAAYGWFLVTPDKMPLSTKVGVWNE